MNDLGRTQRARGSAGGGRSARRRSGRRLGAHQPQGEHGWTVLEDTNGNEVVPWDWDATSSLTAGRHREVALSTWLIRSRLANLLRSQVRSQTPGNRTVGFRDRHSTMRLPPAVPGYGRHEDSACRVTRLAGDFVCQ